MLDDHHQLPAPHLPYPAYPFAGYPFASDPHLPYPPYTPYPHAVEPQVAPAPATTTRPVPMPPAAAHQALGYWIEPGDMGSTKWDTQLDPKTTDHVIKNDGTTKTTITTGDGVTATQTTTNGNTEQSTSIGVGSDGVTATRTNTTGDNSTTQSVGVGSGNVTVTNGSTTATGGSSTSVSVGKDGVGYGTSQTTTNGDQSTTTSGNVTVNPVTGDVTVGGGVTTNGTGASGSLQVGPGGVTGSVNVMAGGAKAGITYSTTFGDITPTLVPEDDHSAVSSILGNQGYLASTRTDKTTLGGSIGVNGIGVAGDTTSGNTMQVFQQLPANWSTMAPADQQKWQADAQAKQQQLLGSTGGLADVALDTMQDGTGVHMTQFNGWDASAGIKYGMMSFSAGGGQTSIHDVTLVKKDGKFAVSMVREDGASSNLGMGVGPIGITTGEQHGDAHQFKFEVDPNDPNAMAALKTFMQTGLLPGADRLCDPESAAAGAKFNAAKTQVDSLSSQIATLQTSLDPANTTQMQQLATMQAQLDTAQHNLDLDRNFLNDKWQAQYGTKVGVPGPMNGVTVDQVTDTHSQTVSGGLSTPVGDIELGRDERSWVHQQYLSANNTAQDRYGFDEKAFVLGNMNSEQAATADTNQSGVVLSLYSDNQMVVPENAQIIRNIKNSDVPSYVVDEFLQHGNELRMPWDQSRVSDGLSGRTSVNMTAQQLNAMTMSLNDMNNPQSVAMWGDFASRASAFMAGGDFTKKTGDQQTDTMFAQGQSADRQGWLMDIASRDPNDPVRKGLNSYGADPVQAYQAAAAQFASITTPAQFQKLSTAQQQLFIAVLGQTSGRDHDLTGTRSNYEAMAAISLLKDDSGGGQDAQLRAQGMRDLFVTANDNAKDDYSDGVYAFVKFTERFKDDPATYNLINKGISFDWKQQDVENIAKNQSADVIGLQFQAAYQNHDLFGNTDTGALFRMVEAANQKGGTQEVQQMVQAAGADPNEMLRRFRGDPVRQQMLYDMLTASGVVVDPASSQLAFCP